jgi:sugar-specific transcriptional regulator TrmB
MSEQTDNIISRLLPFGLEEAESRIYLELLEKRTSTALGISRSLGIGRTRVYRLLDRLVEKGLVVQKLGSGGFIFAASDPGQLQQLVIEKENEVRMLKTSVEETKKILEERLGADVPGSKILYYRGAEGLNRVNWNVLRAKGELLSFEVATADAYMPQVEAEKMRQGLVDNNIFVRTITNKTKLEPYTEVTEMVEKCWEIRHIPERVLDIKTDVFIYNDIYAVCHYLEAGDVFCFEMQNRYMANMQRQLFESLWLQARLMTKIGNKGKVVLS